ncbi:hypothetical protein [Microbacterium halotolerans]|uniref:hypothetical protein n=1 Tax=Microbacterium halotolerans TaxID=246613 RepID=UPI000E6ADC6D|nr:hypothetical protein [Microbacterium halotolerans]
MVYTPRTWQDGEAGGTPIDAASLNNIEQGIADVDSRLTTEESASPTPAEWDDIVSRVEALEAGGA